MSDTSSTDDTADATGAIHGEGRTNGSLMNQIFNTFYHNSSVRKFLDSYGFNVRYLLRIAAKEVLLSSILSALVIIFQRRLVLGTIQEDNSSISTNMLSIHYFCVVLLDVIFILLDWNPCASFYKFYVRDSTTFTHFLICTAFQITCSCLLSSHSHLSLIVHYFGIQPNLSLDICSRFESRKHAFGPNRFFDRRFSASIQALSSLLFVFVLYFFDNVKYTKSSRLAIILSSICTLCFTVSVEISTGYEYFSVNPMLALVLLQSYHRDICYLQLTQQELIVNFVFPFVVTPMISVIVGCSMCWLCDKGYLGAIKRSIVHRKSRLKYFKNKTE